MRDARVLGEGFTQPPGSNHAEVEAILDSRRNGHDVRGSTVYVSLEPCSHFGRTPPCATALSEAKVARVIAAVEDPNPLVSGRGLEMLRNGGVDVRCGLLEQEAAEVERRIFLAHDARAAVGALEDRCQPGRQDRARQWRYLNGSRPRMRAAMDTHGAPERVRC